VAQAKAAAGERAVVLASANIAQQCLNAGLLDVIQVSLVPVLLGQGIPFFQGLTNTPVELDDPTVIEGTRVTHLYYRVGKPPHVPTSPED
jgi:dihydrofolate reductase